MSTAQRIQDAMLPDTMRHEFRDLRKAFSEQHKPATRERNREPVPVGGPDWPNLLLSCRGEDVGWIHRLESQQIELPRAAR